MVIVNISVVAHSRGKVKLSGSMSMVYIGVLIEILTVVVFEAHA